jgi:predicted NAD-dependent protein-ADP-ribosyltransferase YbiA (DUF1768 family)
MFSRGMSEELKQFYKNRLKNPDKFQYDDDGNLVELNKEGSLVKTITLPTYRHPTFEELDLLEKDRMAAIAIATKEYDDAYNELHQEYQKIERLDSTILRLNRKVMEADTNLQHIRFPLRYISKEEGIEIRKMDFNQPNETRKYTYEIAIVNVNPFTLQDQYVRIGQEAPKPIISVVEAKEALARNVPIILFSDIDTNDYGFLSLDWPVEIQLNGTMYHSAKQAIAAEIAKRFNDENNLSRIMLADTADEITYSVDDVPGDKDANQVKWNDYTKQLINDVNTAKSSGLRVYKATNKIKTDSVNIKLELVRPNNTSRVIANFLAQEIRDFSHTEFSHLYISNNDDGNGEFSFLITEFKYAVF